MASSPSTGGAASSGRDEGLGDRLRRWFAPRKLPPPVDPALLKHAQERAQERQSRVADWITAFAGSMAFVYLHILWFGCWIGFGLESYPFGLLTMIVSLEAIFLSTFVMISQNRADARRQVIADQAWRMVQEEDRQNVELLDLSKRILRLTEEVRSYGDTVQAERDQNRELLDLSRQTLALTREVHSFSGAARPADPGSSGRPDDAGPTR
jgi:uncharacterized membrane protein